MKYSLCIEPLFSDLPFHERIEAAKNCGAHAVEFWDITQKDISRIAGMSARLGMPIAAVSFYDSWQVRLDSDRALVLNALQKSIDIAKTLNCPTLIGLAGDVVLDAKSQSARMRENLKASAELLEKHEICLTIEPLNSRIDHKGYALDSSSAAFELMRQVDSPFVKVLFDCYHMQIMEGNLTENICANISAIGHFHSAGVPGRHEPMHGEIQYPFIIDAIETSGYKGYFGLEFWSANDSYQTVKETLAYFKGS